MTDARWLLIERIYHAALELPVSDRAGFVQKEAAGDHELAAEIEALVAYDDRPAAFMNHSALELAARALAERMRQNDENCSGSIGSYELVRTLGAGGMGDVFLARDGRLARNVALKVLRRDASNPDWMAAFHHEALAASALNHPNILTVYEIGEQAGTSFIAAEYVDGITLRERLTQGSIPLPDMLDIALQIAEGLAAAHEAGVVHRDIKPDNVMLRADGLVKILDFGIATRTGPDGPPAPAGCMGADGMVIGTSGYMSPEQRQGLDVDARTDVWALGIVMYEMSTGRLPASAAAADLSHLPAELVRIIIRAMSRERDDRYATGRELARDLLLVRDTVADPSGSRSVGWRAVRRRGAGVRSQLRFAVAALMFLAATASLVALAARSRGANASSHESRDPAAYQLYAKGRYHVERRTPEDLRKGVAYLREAVTVDPTYASAYAKLADAHILLAMTRDVAPKDSFPHARAAAEHALAIDPGLAEARVSMGIIKFWYDWDWSGAEAEFRRAMEAARPEPAARVFYGHLLSNLGDHTRATQELRRALDDQPYSPFANAIFAQALYYEGRYDAAIAHLHKTLELDPSLWLTHNILGRAYAWKGMPREGLLELDKATALGGSLIVRATAGYTLAISGKRDEARAILDELTTRATQGYVPPSNLALVHLGLGERDAALDRLEEAVEARDLLLTFLGVEPRWAQLAGDPRFTAVLSKVGL
ncbi:MAG TPA: protein kinase, partial [Steroidobacteraceae bacterium]